VHLVLSLSAGSTWLWAPWGALARFLFLSLVLVEWLVYSECLPNTCCLVPCLIPLYWEKISSQSSEHLACTSYTGSHYISVTFIYKLVLCSLQFQSRSLVTSLHFSHYLGHYLGYSHKKITEIIWITANTDIKTLLGTLQISFDPHNNPVEGRHYCYIVRKLRPKVQLFV
jgi:hypothetical protein